MPERRFLIPAHREPFPFRRLYPISLVKSFLRLSPLFHFPSTFDVHLASPTPKRITPSKYCAFPFLRRHGYIQ